MKNWLDRVKARLLRLLSFAAYVCGWLLVLTEVDRQTCLYWSREGRIRIRRLGRLWFVPARQYRAVQDFWGVLPRSMFQVEKPPEVGRIGQE